MEINVGWEEHREAERVTGNVIVLVNPHFYRPAELELLIGSPAR